MNRNNGKYLGGSACGRKFLTACCRVLQLATVGSRQNLVRLPITLHKRHSGLSVKLRVMFKDIVSTLGKDRQFTP